VSVTNFEELTLELTDKELKLIPLLESGFSRYTINNPIKSAEIVAKLNANPNISLNFTGPRLRKCVNYIRSRGRLPIIATSDGYFVSYDPTVIQSQIQSLRERANSIISCADNLEHFLE
jgi:hypothetical protein